MDTAKQRALQAAGWKIGDATDFLGMSNEERQLLNVRVELALAVRQQREIQRISQKELGAKLKTSQPRIAKIERAATDVSLDQLVRAFAAAGGKIVVRVAERKTPSGNYEKRHSTATMILQPATVEHRKRR